MGGRVSDMVRRAWPDRKVRREVQGVWLVLPWSHRLPDYAARFPSYGQNLVAIASAIAEVEGEGFGVIDVGANIGDSALQVLAAVDARILCVEADPYWLTYLHENVDHDSRIEVLPALVVAADAPEGGQAAAAAVSAVRRNGTTHFHSAGGDGGAAPTVTGDAMRSRSSKLGSVRLVKTDTDGYDARIVPEIARAWSDDHPVIFFEYVPELAREVGDASPEQVWEALAALGYDHAVVWDNFGGPLGWASIADAARESAVLDRPFADRGYHYWDVAVVHRDDVGVRGALDALVGDPLVPVP